MSIGQQSGWNVIHDRCSSAFNVFVFGFENGQTTAPKMGVEICHRTGAIGRGLPSNQIPHAISICQGDVAHVHRINGSLCFHNTVRSHSSRNSSRALCARVSVCGGAFRAAGVPNVLIKRLSGGTGDGKC